MRSRRVRPPPKKKSRTKLTRSQLKRLSKRLSAALKARQQLKPPRVVTPSKHSDQSSLLVPNTVAAAGLEVLKQAERERQMAMGRPRRVKTDCFGNPIIG